MPTTRIAALDGLRTVAIAFVVLYHVHLPFFTGGFIGVNVFYVLSGYLITTILLSEREKTGRIRLGRFWGRRMLRLYPGLVAVVLAASGLWFLVGNFEGANVDLWVAALLALTYASNIGRWLFHTSTGVLAQTWSLAMEEQFYLVWPPILALLARRRASRVAVVTVLGALIVASSILGWIMYAPRGGTATPDIYFSPTLNVAPLLMGCLLSIALHSEPFAKLLRGRAGLAATWLGAMALVAIELSTVSGWQEQRATFGVVLPLAALAATLLIGGLVSRASVIARVLSLAPIAWFGRNISYSLYLWHVLVLALVLPLVPGIIGDVAAIAAAVVVAIAGHFVIEKGVARLMDRLRPREVDAPAPVEARELVGSRA